MWNTSCYFFTIGLYSHYSWTLLAISNTHGKQKTVQDSGEFVIADSKWLKNKNKGKVWVRDSGEFELTEFEIARFNCILLNKIVINKSDVYKDEQTCTPPTAHNTRMAPSRTLRDRSTSTVKSTCPSKLKEESLLSQLNILTQDVVQSSPFLFILHQMKSVADGSYTSQANLPGFSK